MDRKSVTSVDTLSSSRPAWAVWLLAVIQVVSGLALAWLNQLSLMRMIAEFVISQTVATLAFATAGAIIVVRQPRNRVGWLLCTASIGYGASAWMGQYTRYTFVTHPGALPAGELVAWLTFWTWMPFILLVVVGLPLIFPAGRLPSPRWRPLLWIVIVGGSLVTLSLAVAPGPIDASMPEVANPFAPAWGLRFRQIVEPIGLVLIVIGMVGAVAAQVIRFRHAQHIERQQIKWFAYASALLVAALAIPVALFYPNFLQQDTRLSGMLLTLGYALLAAAIGLAVLRYRLYDIDLLINRTLVYTALSACVAALYVGVVGYLGALFHQSDSLLLSLLATGIVAVVFQPLRAWLQRGVNRLIYGERDDPYAVLTRLGQRLRATIDPGEVLATLVGTVRDALRLPYVAVALRHGDALVVAAADGEPCGEPLILPLTYQRDTVGELRVCPRSPDEAWVPADRQLLANLADQAGVAAHGVRLMTELQQAREQLVLAREEERRRLRNDLHDGVAPSLAALGLTAATVVELIQRDPEAAIQVVGKLQRSIRTAVADVRRLVYDLRPPTLDELGLVEAIREQASRLSVQPAGGGSADAQLHVQIDVSETLPPLPAAVEVAAFRLVQEALNNVLRHARAHSCVIHLGYVAGRALAVEIVDDGIGLPVARRPGVGLRSMRERTAELGGICTIEPTQRGGTRVSAWLPLNGSSAIHGEQDHGDPSHPDRR